MAKNFGFWMTALLFILLSCNEASQTDNLPPVEGIDVSQYDVTKMANNVARLIKKNENGQVVEEGYIKDGKKTGIWTIYEADKVKKITSYLEGRKYGKEFVLDHRRQVVVENTFLNDKLHGKKGTYKFGRPKMESYYVNDKLHGVYNKYIESGADQGKLNQSVEYKHGVIDGKVKYYNTDGEVTVEYDYKNGEKVGGGMIEN